MLQMTKSTYFRKVQGEPSVDAESDDEEGLDGMDDEDEIECLFVSNPIEDEHRLHGKMPRAGTVGRRDDNCYGAYDEGDEGAA